LYAHGTILFSVTHPITAHIYYQQPMVPPPDFNVTAVATDQVRCTWGDAGGEDGYVIVNPTSHAPLDTVLPRIRWGIISRTCCPIISSRRR